MNEIPSALVIGGGIAGIQAALDIADKGIYVYLVEREPAIGGIMAQLDKTFPTHDCAMCILSPKLVEAGRHPNVKILTLSEVMSVSGEAGDFKVKVRKHARYVDEEKCVGCGTCAKKCPKKISNEFDKGLSMRRAIYIKYPQAVPFVYSIDPENCIKKIRGKCGICEKVCPADAIDFEMKDKDIELNVSSIIVASGVTDFDLTMKHHEYGYGTYPNVISSIQFERMVTTTGPYGGEVRRMSDGKLPKRIAFIQCVGSRDLRGGNKYCSSICCMFAIKEAVILKEHEPEVEPHIFFMDMRTFGKEFDEYYRKAIDVYGIKFTKNNRISHIGEDPDTHNLLFSYIEGSELVDAEFDMVVLSVGMKPAKNARELGKVLGIELNEFGFCQTNQLLSPMETTRKGIFVAGAFAGPKDIPESVVEASAAAGKATSVITHSISPDLEVKDIPMERDISGEEPRIGVFVCDCSMQISNGVNVSKVVEHVIQLPDVFYAEENLYTCSQESQEKMIEIIHEYKLNRIVVASCSPRTHATLFQRTLSRAGLNPYLFEMANIREQCALVHQNQMEVATEKAKDLVMMAIAKVRLTSPLKKIVINVRPSGLILGGGISGMSAALELADKGYKAYLVEKEKELGGISRKIYYTMRFKDQNIQKGLSELINRVTKHPNIEIYTESTISSHSGFIGNFNTVLNTPAGEVNLEHGVTIIATGGKEYTPTEYHYGKDERILTQLEFEKKLATEGKIVAKTIVMVLCVGSRNKERNYCSRVCCIEAIKNALKLKELQPEANVYILYRDMRTYGESEIKLIEATEKGIIFIRFEDNTPPEVSLKKKELNIKVKDIFLDEEISLNPDLIVLNSATLPNPDNEHLSKIFKVPLSMDNFFLEAHMKLRPIESDHGGIFLCGLAHSPKLIEECIAQAQAAACKAATIISKPIIEMDSIVSKIEREKCTGCGTCITLCPYGAIEKDHDGIAKPAEALCMGCGICAASCTEKAIDLRYFTDEQLISQIKAALQVG